MKKLTIPIASLLIIASACATFKSPINGRFEVESTNNPDAEKVNLLFVFYHYKQTIGTDAIPKLTSPSNNFNNMFLDALNEISNMNKYYPVTMHPNDIGNIQKQDDIIRDKKEKDYTIEMTFKREKSFAKFFFSTIGSSISATVLPMRYRYKYSLEAKVYNNKQELLKTYYREAELKKWVQSFMLFLYPFYHENKQSEELYVEFMGNIFQEMEADKILDYSKVGRTSRTIYASSEMGNVIDSWIPKDAIGWNKKPINEWIDKKDISIIVHFPDDGMQDKMAMEAFKMDTKTLDRETEEDGLLFWIDKEEKNPTLLISVRNESVLKAQLENNNYLRTVINGMFYLK